jgi:hypothetical protein
MASSQAIIEYPNRTFSLCLLFAAKKDKQKGFYFTHLSNALACASLMMLTVTMGGDICTFSFVPTSSRTVAEKRVFVFKT